MSRTADSTLRFLPLLLILLVAPSCNYGLSTAGGFPPNVHTLYIAPLDNKTVKADLQQQIFSALQEKLPRSLGVLLAGEDAADAVLRGEITRYNDAAQNYRPGEQGNVTVIQHQVEIGVALRIIDVKNNVYIWESAGIVGRGQYRPDTQNDEVARRTAIDNLIQQIIDGAQSQW
jgi:hypothetical protein